MAMQLDKVVPFGRSLDEYRQMFSFQLRFKTSPFDPECIESLAHGFSVS